MCWLSYSKSCTLLTVQFLSQTKKSLSKKLAEAWKKAIPLTHLQWIFPLFQYYGKRLEFNFSSNHCTKFLHLDCTTHAPRRKSRNPELWSSKKELKWLEREQSCGREITAWPKKPAGILCPKRRSEPGYPKEGKLSFQLGDQRSSQGRLFLRAPFCLRGPPGELLPCLAHLQSPRQSSRASGLRLDNSYWIAGVKEQKQPGEEAVLCWLLGKKGNPSHPTLPTGDLFYSAQPPLGSDPDPTAGSRNNPIEISALQAKFYMAKGERGERQRGQVKKYTCMIVGSKP